MSEQADFWNERYRDESFAFGRAPNAFLASQKQYLKPGLRVLVPGDGEGRNGVWLAEQGLIVDTVDISPLGVAKARDLAKTRGVSINQQVGDLLTWDAPQNTYDIVASLYVHFFDADRPSVHRSMLNALKPGGVLLLEAFSVDQVEFKKKYHSGGPPTEEMLYSKSKLAADFAQATVLQLEELTTELNEGHRHKGLAAVVRAVFRKPGSEE